MGCNVEESAGPKVVRAVQAFVVQSEPMTQELAAYTDRQWRDSPHDPTDGNTYAGVEQGMQRFAARADLDRRQVREVVAILVHGGGVGEGWGDGNVNLVSIRPWSHPATPGQGRGIW